MLTVAPVPATEPIIRFLWDKFEPEREMFGEAFSKDILAFGAWLSAPDVVVFLVSVPEANEPIGTFIFNQVIPGGSAMAHINVWGRHLVDHGDLVAAAQTTCGAMMQAFRLNRIGGLTPVTLPSAKAFAQQVGFHVVGTMRQAMLVRGEKVDAWLSDLLPGDLPAESGILEKKE